MISAKVVADSLAHSGRITTFELEFPRWILAEFNTHRAFSRNGASSRAIPLKVAIQNVKDWLVKPIRWGKNQAGMSAMNEDIDDIASAEQTWNTARESACAAASILDSLKLHKQWAARILEPFSLMKVVCTATEFDNFFHLRYHPDAQPEIQELAKCMWKARSESVPKFLNVGDWHVPYYSDGSWSYGCAEYNTLEEALMISASCCAQVSYRKSDDTLEKAKMVFDRLLTSVPLHASPAEHQATPMPHGASFITKGVTHQTYSGHAAWWSGNFKNWIQHRQLLQGHTCWEFSAP